MARPTASDVPYLRVPRGIRRCGPALRLRVTLLPGGVSVQQRPYRSRHDGAPLLPRGPRLSGAKSDRVRGCARTRGPATQGASLAAALPRGPQGAVCKFRLRRQVAGRKERPGRRVCGCRVPLVPGRRCGQGRCGTSAHFLGSSSHFKASFRAKHPAMARTTRHQSESPGIETRSYRDHQRRKSLQ
jgi:hypothetical protein